MFNIDELQDLIQRAIESANALSVECAAVKDYSNDLAGELHDMTAHGTAERISEAGDRVAEAIAIVASATQKLQETEAIAQAAKEGLTSTGGASPPPPPSTPVATDRERNLPVLRSKVGLSGTYAQVYDTAGKAVSNLFRAHRDAIVPDVERIKPQHRHDTTVTWHAEGHAASFLRQSESGQLEVVQTMTPCQAANGCDANIKKVIPQGKTLRVTQLRKNGKTRPFRYEGTGEWLT